MKGEVAVLSLVLLLFNKVLEAYALYLGFYCTVSVRKIIKNKTGTPGTMWLVSSVGD